MRPVLCLLLIICSLVACNKDETDTRIIIEPPPLKITRDTFTSGSWRGFAIGQTTTQVYDQIQHFQSDITKPYLGIIGNAFLQLSQVENKIPLYNQLLLDETAGTNTGVQVTFEEDKVSSIYTNNGDKLSVWPAGASANASIKVGDAIGSIYQKLTQINTGAFKNKLQRISLFSKDVFKAYDPSMTVAPYWEFSTIVGGKHYVVDLYFTAGVLTTIYVNLLEQM